MRPASALPVLLLLIAAAAMPAEAKLDAAADRTLGYLEDHAATSGSLAPNVAEAAHALGKDPAAWPPGDPVAARIEVPGPDASNVSLLRPLRALALAGDPRAGIHGELTARVAGRVQPSGYGDPRTINDDAYAILALLAARPIDDREPYAPMVRALSDSQDGSGGWGWAVGGTPGTDMTGLAVEALWREGGSVPESLAVGAQAFLTTTRHPDGGFAETPGGQRNCESTVWGIRASYRLAGRLEADDWDFLLGLQQRDGGFAHLEGGRSDLLCTTEAAGLLGEMDVDAPAASDEVPAPTFPMLAALLTAICAVAMSTRLRQP